jgi:glycosyltransferase involved in cell wall biosynthesis
VHLHSLGLAGLALELRRRFGLPLVYTAHSCLDAELPRLARASGWAGVQDAVLAASDHVVFPSAAERDRAVRRRPALAARSSVVANGVEPPSAAAPEGPRDGPVVFAGRFAASKGVELAVSVARLAGRARPLRFVFAGGHGDEREQQRVERLARRHPGSCAYAGWLRPRALERLLRAASVVLVPSRYEPFGLVALEAMRAGAPVLASEVGGLREVVVPGSGGVALASDRPADWRDALVALWDAPDVRADLGRRGPRHVAERYDADVLAGTLVSNVYAPLVARRAA